MLHYDWTKNGGKVIDNNKNLVHWGADVFNVEGTEQLRKLTFEAWPA